VVLRYVLNRSLCQILARRAAFEHGRHIVGGAIRAVKLVEQRHRGFRWGEFAAAAIAATPPIRIGFDIEAPLASDGMQPLGM